MAPHCAGEYGEMVCRVAPDDSYMMVGSWGCGVVWKVDLPTGQVGMHALAMVVLVSWPRDACWCPSICQ